MVSAPLGGGGAARPRSRWSGPWGASTEPTPGPRNSRARPERYALIREARPDPSELRDGESKPLLLRALLGVPSSPWCALAL
eukprot:14069529-Alexandrium_andersonii.AAC.1